MVEHLFPLKDRREVAEGTMAFWFDSSGSDFTFKPGQNADFILVNPSETDAEGNARTFSFCSSPNEKGTITVATRMRPTAFKKCLKVLPLGTRVKVSQAMGSFTLHKDVSKAAVFLAGGIGVTPMRSIIQWAIQERLPHKLYLFYSNRNPAAAAFLNDFEAWAKQNPQFTLIATITEAKHPGWGYELGRVNKEMLTRHVPNLQQAIYYLAGPPGMVAGMRELLDSLGVSEDNLKTEEFAGY